MMPNANTYFGIANGELKVYRDCDNENKLIPMIANSSGCKIVVPWEVNTIQLSMYNGTQKYEGIFPEFLSHFHITFWQSLLSVIQNFSRKKLLIYFKPDL